MGPRVDALVDDDVRTAGAHAEDPDAQSALRTRIGAAIERIRPALQMDGGDITFLAFEDGVLRVGLTGACSGCHNVAATTSKGVERVLRSLVPEVRQVEAVEA